jgi:hypothetical protein
VNVRVLFVVLFCKALVDHSRVESFCGSESTRPANDATDRNDFALRLLRSSGNSRCRCVFVFDTLYALRTKCSGFRSPGCTCVREVRGFGAHRAHA